MTFFFARKTTATVTACSGGIQIGYDFNDPVSIYVLLSLYVSFHDDGEAFISLPSKIKPISGTSTSYAISTTSVWVVCETAYEPIRNGMDGVRADVM
jgi:hypothetical protein